MSSQQDLIKPIDAEAFMSSILRVTSIRQLTANSGGFKGCSSGPYTNVSTADRAARGGGEAYARLYRCICPRPRRGY